MYSDIYSTVTDIDYEPTTVYSDVYSTETDIVYSKETDTVYSTETDVEYKPTTIYSDIYSTVSSTFRKRTGILTKELDRRCL